MSNQSSAWQSPLLYTTENEWTETVINDMDTFLLDHAAAEKKASGMAISMLSHYPDRLKLVRAMADLAIEELCHYREVVKLIHQRGLITGADSKDHYVIAFRKHMRKDSEEYLMDRLIIAGLIEARGAERFGLIAEALQDEALKTFYDAIARSEQGHFDQFRQLAYEYFSEAAVDQRIAELLPVEAELIAAQPIQAALH